ncbi:MAG: NADH-quinone oxidoreductase subunit J [Cyanobacteria bacterium]|nr:NADH-quinone oxidoreductase subunit J [Cyanobacteriota bacterium]MDA1021237.1 NADH-quinone oxidoreductase subunit J [Cyanobacteriota bacterium]
MDLLAQFSHIPFYILAAAAVICSLGMIFLDNLVRAGFLLIGAFSAIAGIYFLLNANFVAVSQILIYAVGIVLVIIFAVMLCNLKQKPSDVDDTEDKVELNTRNILALIVSTGLFTLMVKVITSQDWDTISKLTGAKDNLADIDEVTGLYTARIGQLMLSNYIVAFELISVLLLIVLVGAIILSKKELETKEAA